MPLSREEISVLAHGDHPIACPLSDRSVDELIGKLKPTSNCSVVDVGCGFGEWSRRVILAHPDCLSIGIDSSYPAIEEARQRSAALPIVFEHCDAVEYLRAAEAFDIILCNGSTHIFGGFQSTLDALGPMLRPGGEIIVSDGFWQSAPSKEVLNLLGMETGGLQTFEGAIALAATSSFEVIDSYISSSLEWDVYEDSWCNALERHADRNCNASPETKAQLLDVAASHRSQYYEGYRGILGYVALVLRKNA